MGETCSHGPQWEYMSPQRLPRGEIGVREPPEVRDAPETLPPGCETHFRDPRRENMSPYTLPLPRDML